MRDSKGRFCSKNLNHLYGTTQVASKFKSIKKKSGQLVNHIAIVLDRSSSMFGIRNEVVAQFNKQVETIKENSKKTGQKTFVSLWTFSDKVDIAKLYEVPVENLRKWVPSDYDPSGYTALFDGVGIAINRLNEIVVEDNHSFLVITITDGEENASRKYSAKSLKELIQKVTATDKWSFAFLTPASGKEVLLNFGIPEGNIQVWEATSYGTVRATQSLTTGTSGYYATRSSGLGSTASFFTPDLSNVPAAKMQRKLEDASKEFLRVPVNCDERIDTCVEHTIGDTYRVGSGYYQLTKSEKVQDYKGIVIRDKNTNKLYAGRDGEDLKEVRRLLNIPLSGTVRLHKATHPTYDIFIKSTSVNRKLISGTILLLDKTLI